MDEKERRKSWTEATNTIKQILKGEIEPPITKMVLTTQKAIDGFETEQAIIEKQMLALAKQLPIRKWVEGKSRRGFGLLFLAIVIGETGDLATYANPAKVWRRLGCAPWTYQEKTLMGATWRGGKEGKLPAEEWQKYGYNPRRRSIAYLIGEGIVKQNGGGGNGENAKETETAFAGPYRRRYDEAKEALAAKHPEYKPMRCHLHGMLLATKMLLRDLWAEWNKGDMAGRSVAWNAGDGRNETETEMACV